MNIKEFLSTLMGFGGKHHIVVSADAYMTARYGRITSTGELLKEFVDQMDDMIKLNSENGKAYAAKDVNIEIVPYINQIEKLYVRRGFKVAFLGSRELNRLAKGGFDRTNIILVSWAAPEDIVITNRTAEIVLGLDESENESQMIYERCENEL